MSSPRTPRIADSTSAGVVPGGRRQSTTTSQIAGMMFRFCEALMIVGENVGPSSGSTISRAVAGSVSSCASSARRNAATSGSTTCGGRYAASRSISGAALTSALSAMPGMDACPDRPRTRMRNGADIFSATVHT
jgi:hypothetical protein